MATQDIKVEFGRVDFDAINTDDDYRREAHRLLPEAIVQCGEAMGTVAWDKLQDGLKGSGMEMNNSASDRRKHIRESGQDYKRTIGAARRKELEDELVRMLREQKTSKA